MSTIIKIVSVPGSSLPLVYIKPSENEDALSGLDIAGAHLHLDPYRISFTKEERKGRWDGNIRSCLRDLHGSDVREGARKSEYLCMRVLEINS